MIKQSDIAMIILITAVSLVASFLIGNALIDSPEQRSVEVEVAVPFDSDFPEPSKEIFNENAINPTEIIIIGDADKERPFENN